MTPDPTLIEQVARAICGRDLEWRDCESVCLAAGRCVGNLSECVIEDAKAAIEALQGSAALPSEAVTPEMIDCPTCTVKAGRRCRNALGGFIGIYHDDRIIAAMRATTPTAPVQDDDAEWLRHFVHAYEADISPIGRDKLLEIASRLARPTDAELADILAYARDLESGGPLGVGNWARNTLIPFLSHLSPTPETGLVEALHEETGYSRTTIKTIIARYTSLSNVLPDEV